MTEGPAAFEGTVGPEHEGLRVDRYLAEVLAERASRSLIQRHIEAGAVAIDGQPPRRGAKTPLSAGNLVTYRPPEAPPVALTAEAIPLAILYEDADLIVIDKPKGLVVHPAAGHPSGTLVNALLHHVKDWRPIAGELRPGIVHRLDRDTTGALVVAKHDKAHRNLTDMFKAREVEKQYLAITHGIPRVAEQTLDTPYGRHPHERKRFTGRLVRAEARELGSEFGPAPRRALKRAITHYTVAERYVGAAMLEVRIETGRTHQIRVHLSEMGFPIVGDAVYGERRGRRTIDKRTRAVLQAFDRPALHAQHLAFAHPISGEPMEFEAPVPDDLAGLIAALRAAGIVAAPRGLV